MATEPERLFSDLIGALRPKGDRWRGCLTGDFTGNVDAPIAGWKYVRIPIAGTGDYSLGMFPSGGAGGTEYNTPVLIEYDPINHQRIIAGPDSQAIGATIGGGGIPDPGGFGLPAHAWTHQLGGNDQLVIAREQLSNLQISPSTTAGHVTVSGGVCVIDGVLVKVYLPLDVDLTAYYPATGVKYVWLTLTAAGAVSVIDPAVTDITALTWPSTNNHVLGFVMLKALLTTINWSAIKSVFDVIKGVTSHLPAATAQYQVITSGPNPYPAAWSTFLLSGTAGGKTVLAVTAGQTLTLTATGNFNLTIPATGTVALLGIPNVFTVNQEITGNLLFTKGATRQIVVNAAGVGEVGSALTIAAGASQFTTAGTLTLSGGEGSVGLVNGGDAVVAGGVSAAGDGGSVKLKPGAGPTSGHILLYYDTNATTQYVDLDTSLISGGYKYFRFPNVSGVGALGAGTLTRATANDVTVANHTHAITSSTGLVGVGTAQYQVLTTGANPYPAVWSGFLLDGTAGGKTIFTVTNGKTVTLTATDNSGVTFTGAAVLTVPETMTAAGRDVANTFTINQTISNAAPSLILTDTTAAAKSLTIAVDANVANFRESAGAAGSLLVLDLANNKVGIGVASPQTRLHAVDSAVAGATYDASDVIAIERNGNCALNIIAANTNNSGIMFSDNDARNRGIVSYLHASDAMVFYTSAAERVRIDSSGKVGILMTPTYTLDVTGNFRCSSGFGCNGTIPQTAYASGGALAAYGAGANGLDTGANMSALHAMVVKIWAALVANGIMS